VALFDVEAAELINCGLYKLANIAFEFEDMGNTYFVKEKKN
jgi:hypothetical protein